MALESTIKRRVRQFREEAKLTQSELAKAVGASQSTISRIELGGVIPTVHLIFRMARLKGYERPIDWFVQGGK